jgi:hypothetical protein
VKDKPPAFDYFKERDEITDEEERIFGAASIPDEEKAQLRRGLERCGEIIEPDFRADHDLPPLFTKARREEETRREDRAFQTYFYCLRDVVFSIDDIDVRLKLIGNERKFRALRVKSAQHDYWESERELEKAERDFGPVHQPLLIALFFVAGGWREWGLVGAIGGSVLSIIYGLHAVRDFAHKRQRRVKEATDLVSERLAHVNKRVSQSIFSIHEEDFAEPDIL